MKKSWMRQNLKAQLPRFFKKKSPQTKKSQFSCHRTFYSKKQFRLLIKQFRKAKLKNLQMKFHLMPQKQQPLNCLPQMALILLPPIKNFTCQLPLLAKNLIPKSKLSYPQHFLASVRISSLQKLILPKSSKILNWQMQATFYSHSKMQTRKLIRKYQNHLPKAIKTFFW